MEQASSTLVPGQRSTSGRFNPEAATFSPTTAKAGLAAGEPTPPASPQKRVSRMPRIFDGKSSQAPGEHPIGDPDSLRGIFRSSKTGTLADLESEDSPFRPTKSMRPVYQGLEKGSVPRLPRALPDQKNMPLEELQKMLQGKRSTQQYQL
jgi:hypothetical protein